MKDSYGNEMKVEVKQEGNKIIHTKIYTLEEGKTTLRGEYRKFKNDNECVYPERLSCNSEVGCDRCPYMKMIRVGNWHCIFEKNKE